jgi:hypothetical protein
MRRIRRAKLLMRHRTLVAAGIAFALLAAGSGAALGAVEHSAGKPRGLFAGQALLPGKSVHADITVKGARVPIRPYLEISALHQRCEGPTCAAGAPILAQALQLSASDSAGQTWTETVATTQKRVTLPGGTLAAGHGRTYQLTLALPAHAGNNYEGLSVSGTFSWGGTDAAGHNVSSASDGNRLPFTGFNAIELLVLAGILVGTGIGLVATTKRRRQR